MPLHCRGEIGRFEIIYNRDEFDSRGRARARGGSMFASERVIPRETGRVNHCERCVCVCVARHGRENKGLRNVDAGEAAGGWQALAAFVDENEELC